MPVEKTVLHFVAGAPGVGKSTVVKTLLAQPSEFVYFDMDWLIEPASRLAGRDIHIAPETWPPYGALWLEVLHAVYRNGRVPVLFTPNDPSDVAGPLPAWCSGLEWFLLDCDDATRRVRLQRRGWGTGRLEEALRDAEVLRRLIPSFVDTADLTPAEVADKVLEWLRTPLRTLP